MTAGGYSGRALVVDVSPTSATGSALELPEPVLRAYLGGVGLGTWLLHRLAPARVDPLAPEAPLAFVFSPLVVRGRAAELSVLLVDASGVRLEPAPELAGMSAAAAETAVKERFGRGWRTAAIGPAGERGVRYATI